MTVVGSPDIVGDLLREAIRALASTTMSFPSAAGRFDRETVVSAVTRTLGAKLWQGVTLTRRPSTRFAGASVMPWPRQRGSSGWLPAIAGTPPGSSGRFATRWLPTNLLSSSSQGRRAIIAPPAATC